MEIVDINSPEAKSEDVVAENIRRLGDLFPELLTEGPAGPSVNIDVLKQLVGDSSVSEIDEKYGLSWFGKRNARKMALTPSLGTLLPCPEESEDWDATKNLMIEGDNLEVLKMLQKSYSGKVKLIYIDPPYNTGKDFVYPDNYQDNIKNYLELTGQTEEGRKTASNTESSGRFHTAWLNMMYPRLKLAHSLLSDDGAIFASCDEAEQPRFRALLDEVFGSENFIADMVWAAGRKNDSAFVSISHEYILCYVKSKVALTSKKAQWRQRKKGLDDIYAAYENIRKACGIDYKLMTAKLKEWFKSLPDSHPAKQLKHYSNVDFRGIFFPDNISWPGGGGPRYEILHPTTGKPVAIPSRGWIIGSKEKMEALIDDDRVCFGPDERSVPTSKAYLRDREYSAPYSVFYQDGRAATKRLRSLMGGDYFDYPKDEGVLREIVEMTTADNDIVLDFFAGSGTTGQAVMEENALDGGNRQFILVQLPEPLLEENKEQAAALAFCKEHNLEENIAALTAERLRRAGAKVRSENPMFAGDVGFRVFKLAESNIRAWNPLTEDLEGTLRTSEDHLVEGRSELDVLYEILLKRGLDLCIPIETKEIAGHHVNAVGGGVLFACLDSQIAQTDVETLAEGIVAWRKELSVVGDVNCIFRDSAFDNDVAKSNMSSILEQAGFTKIQSL